MASRRGAAERLLKVLLNEAAAMSEEHLEEMLKTLRANMRVNKQIGEDPFVVLGVSPGDPLDLINAVHRLKARYYHPDNKETGNVVVFKRLQVAYTQVQQILKHGGV